jgi:hypothetical protein
MHAFHRSCVAAVAAALAACSGGSAGAAGARPNRAPELTMPDTLTATGTGWLAAVPADGTATFGFAAADPDGDPLTWRVDVTESDAFASGLVPPAGVGPSFEVRFAAAPVPTTATMVIVADDGRGGSASAPVRIVRTGPPQLLAVEPRAAFAARPQRLTLFGHGFDQDSVTRAVVRVDFAEASEVTTLDNHRLRARMHGLPVPGPVAVTVANDFGSATLADAVELRTFPPAWRAQDVRLGMASDVVAFDVARDGPVLHVLAAHGLAATLVYQQSLDGGATWLPLVAIDGLETPTEPVLAVEAGAAAFAWIGDGSAVWFRGGSVANPQRLDGGGPLARSHLRLAAAGPRRHVAWVEPWLAGGISRVVAAASTDGVNWAPPQPIAPSAATQGEPVIGAMLEQCWAVFTDDSLGSLARGVYASRSIDGGQSWRLVRRLSDATNAVSRLRAHADGPRLHVAWLQQNGLRYCTSPDLGATWSSPIVVDDGLAAPVTDHAVAASGDRVAIAYVAGTELRLARIEQPDGAVQHRRVDDDPAPSGDPQVHVSGDHVHLAWREGTPGAATTRVRAAVSLDVGATVAWAGTLGDGFAAQRQPRLLHDGARLVLAWLDDRDGPPFLFTNATLH